MLSTDTPEKISLAFADTGSKRDIPNPSQVSITPGAASFETGFPPKTFLPVSLGGIPPDGLDFNGLFNRITDIQRWQSAGGSFEYDAAFATDIGGYPKGAKLISTDAETVWMNRLDGNTTDPDSVGAANWVSLSSSASIKFKQLLAAAVETDLQERGQQVFLLWDVLNAAQRVNLSLGTLDMTTPLQALIDHGNTLRVVSGGYPSGGIVIKLPAGRIRFTQITRKNNVSLQGAGRYKTLLLMSQNGGVGFKCQAAVSQSSADNVYWLEDSNYSLIPNPAVTFSSPTMLWDFTGFSRTCLTNVSLAFKTNITAVGVLNATTAGTGGPSQWYNDFYNVFCEGEASGGIGWDLGSTAADKEQVTTWNWHGGRTSGNAVAGIGMRLNSATNCNLYGHTFEGLADELIVGSLAGPRITQQILISGCLFEGSGNGYTLHPTATSTVIVGGFRTGVTNVDNGVRTTIIGDGVTTFPVAASNDSFVIKQASPAYKPQVSGSTAPGFRFKNAAGNWIDVACGANTSAGAEYFRVDDDAARVIVKAGTARTQLYGSQLSIANQSAVSWFVGAGTPEGAIVASPGSFYSRTNGGAGTSFYVKETGTGNTGWVAK